MALVFIAFVFVCSLSMLNGANPYYGMNYNYFDEMAQSMCTAVTGKAAWVFAIRRNCGGGKGAGPRCNDICRSAKRAMYTMINGNRPRAECFDAFHIQKSHKSLTPNPGHLQPDAGKPFMAVYRYFSGGCTWKPDHCGPNYCCCRMVH